MCILLDTIPALDGQTDGQTEMAKQYRVVRAAHAIKTNRSGPLQYSL